MRRGGAATSCSATPWSTASPRDTTGWTSCSPSCSSRAEANDQNAVSSWRLDQLEVEAKGDAHELDAGSGSGSRVGRGPGQGLLRQQLGFDLDHDTRISD